MDIQLVSNIIQNITVVLASIIAIYGINSWRREAKWKRKYALIEDALVLFYEVSEKFKIIRSAFSFSGEGKTRKRSVDETEEESHRLDQAYVVFERWEKEKEAFLKLQAIRFRFIAVFGKEYEEPFLEIQRMINEILLASNRLGQQYWRDQGQKQMSEAELQRHLKKMNEAEKKIWEDADEKDEIRNRIEKAILKIELLYQNVLKK